jgi:GT2 family glycosyltransferase
MVQVNHEEELRISVIICTFRRTDSLLKAIDSLYEQTLPSNQFEIIVIDNNSMDKTEESLQLYIRNRIPKFKYINEKKQGLSYARNTGVNYSSSPIIAFLDDDAIADSNWLSSLLEIYSTTQDAMAVGGKVLPIWSCQRPLWLEDNMLRELSIIDWGDEKRPLIWPERIIGTNCSFKRSVFSKVGLFDINLGRRNLLLLGNEDTEIQERIHEIGKLIYYTPNAIVYHQIPSDRVKKTYFYRRAYGSGRSEAILFARKNEYKMVFKKSIGIFLRSLKQTFIITKSFIFEDRRYKAIHKQAWQIGFLYQTISLFFSWKSWTNFNPKL